MEPQTETPASAKFEELVQNANDIIAGRKPTQLMPEEPRVEHFMKWIDPNNRPRQETVDWFYL